MAQRILACTIQGTQSISAVPGEYTITEAAPSGWILSSIVCTDPDDGTSSDTSSAKATIDLDGGETVKCVFLNSQENAKVGSITIVKTADSANGTEFNFTSTVSEASNFTLTNGGR